MIATGGSAQSHAAPQPAAQLGVVTGCLRPRPRQASLHSPWRAVRPRGRTGRRGDEARSLAVYPRESAGPGQATGREHGLSPCTRPHGPSRPSGWRAALPGRGFSHLEAPLKCERRANEPSSSVRSAPPESVSAAELHWVIENQRGWPRSPLPFPETPPVVWGFTVHAVGVFEGPTLAAIARLHACGFAGAPWLPRPHSEPGPPAGLRAAHWPSIHSQRGTS